MLKFDPSDEVKSSEPTSLQAAQPNKQVPIHIALLYERVLRAALGWFEAPVAWHSTTPSLARCALGVHLHPRRLIRGAGLV